MLCALCTALRYLIFGPCEVLNPCLGIGKLSQLAVAWSAAFAQALHAQQHQHSRFLVYR